jgi:8-oxo-dGTP pyrophosphatase MutT (NUDIX family)
MNIKYKILAIIYKKKNKTTKFLALRNNPSNKIHSDNYYVVTGDVKKDENYEDALRREINEETGIENIIKLEHLKEVYEYKCKGKGNYLCKEHAYLVEVDDEVKHLSAEHTDFKWLNKNNFIKTIQWDGDKNDLIEILNHIVFYTVSNGTGL